MLAVSRPGAGLNDSRPQVPHAKADFPRGRDSFSIDIGDMVMIPFVYLQI